MKTRSLFWCFPLVNPLSLYGGPYKVGMLIDPLRRWKNQGWSIKFLQVTSSKGNEMGWNKAAWLCHVCCMRGRELDLHSLGPLRKLVKGWLMA